MNLMDEAQKKRITNSYQDILVPYFLSEIENAENCRPLEQLYPKFKGVQEQLVTPREANTKRLERKLKKEKEPKTVLNLLLATL